jgi:hypothetical protein
MRLKTVTLLAAITQSVACAFSGASFVGFVLEAMRFSSLRANNTMFLVSRPIGLVAQAVFAFFLFYLYSKQKDN